MLTGSNLSFGDCSGDCGRILRFNGSTGAFIDVFVNNLAGVPNTCNRLSEAMALVFAPDGHLLVGNDAAKICPSGEGDRPYNVLKFNGVTGQSMGIFVDTFSQRLYDPNFMVIGPDGNLYIAEENGNNQKAFDPAVPFGRVLRYNATTGVFINEFVANGGGGITEPMGIAFGLDGNLYVASGDGGDTGANGIMVLKYNGSTGAFMNGVVTDGLTAPWNDIKGILFVADPRTPVIPTLSQWALVALSLFLLGLGWTHFRRRGSATA